MSIRRNDMVMVITGKDKGKTGKVLSVDKSARKVLVQGVNMIKRHQKPTQKQRRGGIVQKEAYINISNAMYYDEKIGKASKIGHKLLDDGKKVRVSKKSGEVIETK